MAEGREFGYEDPDLDYVLDNDDDDDAGASGGDDDDDYDDGGDAGGYQPETEPPYHDGEEIELQERGQ